jgi:Uma2 family endonuclease
MAIPHQKLTLEQFLELPDEKPALEYVHGTVTQKVAPRPRHSRLQTKLAEWFNRFGEPRQVALAFVELRTTYSGSSFVPDVSVYRWERLPADASGELLEECLAPPDIAVEVASPGQSISGLANRCRWYVEHGVRMAILLEPRREVARVFEPDRAPRTLSHTDQIDFDAIIPGFVLSVGEVFALLRVPPREA